MAISISVNNHKETSKVSTISELTPQKDGRNGWKESITLLLCRSGNGKDYVGKRDNIRGIAEKRGMVLKYRRELYRRSRLPKAD